MNSVVPSQIRGAWVRRELAKALDSNVLSLVYQPKIDLETGALSGVEALVRWSHRERGPISPAEFIPIAEESDLIDDLTIWVADRAFQQAAAWVREGYLGTMALNVSARNLKRVDFPDILADLCRRCGGIGLLVRPQKFGAAHGQWPIRFALHATGARRHRRQ